MDLLVNPRFFGRTADRALRLLVAEAKAATQDLAQAGFGVMALSLGVPEL